MGLFDGTSLERPVLCDRCGLDVKVCKCMPLEELVEEPTVEPAKQKLTIRLEKRKRGKWMTVIKGVRGSAAQRQEWFTGLKNHCGAGGTLVDKAIEIQGDQQSRAAEYLSELGFKIRS